MNQFLLRRNGFNGFVLFEVSLIIPPSCLLLVPIALTTHAGMTCYSVVQIKSIKSLIMQTGMHEHVVSACQIALVWISALFTPCCHVFAPRFKDILANRSVNIVTCFSKIGGFSVRRVKKDKSSSLKPRLTSSRGSGPMPTEADGTNDEVFFASPARSTEEL